jgi:hypothetical protein
MSKVVKFGEIIMKEENVIKVNNKVPFINQVTENVIHEGLKSCRGVAKAKGHD